MLQRLKQRVTKLEAASEAMRPPMPPGLLGQVADEAIELLPLPAWEWVLELASIDRIRTGQDPEARLRSLSETIANWTALTYGLRLHETYSQEPNYWIITDIPQSIPYLIRCSRPELTVLSPSERQALLEQAAEQIDPKVSAMKVGDKRLVDLQLPRLFEPFRTRYARALEEQRRAVPLPEIAEYDSLDEKRVKLGNWFRSRWAEKRRAYGPAET